MCQQYTGIRLITGHFKIINQYLFDLQIQCLVDKLMYLILKDLQIFMHHATY